ncbi:MAG: hypothetical protein FH758_13950 [Firmicutes bacterium]|nr:hypothetical protein [Bacillota bacterium]
MGDRYIDANPGYEHPELQQNLHHPVGIPQPREIKSQKAQLNSVHRHGTRNDVKMGIKYKIAEGDRK